MASRSKSFIKSFTWSKKNNVEISDGCMVHQWVTQGTKGSIDNARRPGRGLMMRPTISEESQSDCLRKKNLRRRHCLHTVKQNVLAFFCLANPFSTKVCSYVTGTKREAILFLSEGDLEQPLKLREKHYFHLPSTVYVNIS